MKTLIEYMEGFAKKEGITRFDYEDGAIFPSKNGRFTSVQELLEFMEHEHGEKQAEADRIQLDEYYRSEQYKIDKAMSEKEL